MTTATKTHKLKYELTGSKKPKKDGINVISEMQSSRILWHLVVRHKLSLWQLYAVAITALYIKSLF